MVSAPSPTSAGPKHFRLEPPPLGSRLTFAGALQLAYQCANDWGMLRVPALEWSYLHLYFLYKRFVEDPYAALVGRRAELFRGGHILDVGANVGYDTALFARALSPGCRVFAFEPEQENFRRLRTVAAAAERAERISVHRLAVGAAEGAAALAVDPRHAGGHHIATASDDGARQQIEMTSLDGFLAREDVRGRIGFVKIDVQGYELEVSRGMEGLIGDNPDLVVGLELEPSTLRRFDVSVEDLVGFYTERSFRAFAIGSRGLEPIGASELCAIPEDGYVDVILSRQLEA
jgi:FkbM family methyltransferase